jgi:hypothetical protein
MEVRIRAKEKSRSSILPETNNRVLQGDCESVTISYPVTVGRRILMNSPHARIWTLLLSISLVWALELALRSAVEWQAGTMEAGIASSREPDSTTSKSCENVRGRNSSVPAFKSRSHA